MKIYLRIFLLLFLSLPSFCLENKIYSISVCTTSSKEEANRCKENISRISNLETFIQENPNKTYSSYLGNFNSYNEAKHQLNNSPAFIKKQKPFIKIIEKKIANENIQILDEKINEKMKQIDESIIKINKEIKESKNLDFLNYLEDMKKLNAIAISSIKPNPIILLNNNDSFENLIIQVDSSKNIMFLKGKNKDGKIIDIKTYKVSTAKTNIKKPQGIGSITSISLNPQWNPTDRTLKAFRQKGIILPSIVPFGHKLNYMGSAKINLTHKVDGQEVYRIHGTLSEDTIGTNESGGCIRMKNKEVVELVTLLNEFTNNKDFSKVKVILE